MKAFGVPLDVHDGSEEMLEAPADTDPAADDGEDRENHQWDEHGIRRFVNVVLDFMVHARLAVKGEEQQAEHVERGHAGGEPADEPEEMAGAEGVAENLVLAEKAGERR